MCRKVDAPAAAVRRAVVAGMSGVSRRRRVHPLHDLRALRINPECFDPQSMQREKHVLTAIAKAKALALRVLADWVEDEDQSERIDSVTFAYA
ncbi:MAG: hypothetical protein ACK47M_19905 [Caldilinea sp.]